MAVTLRKTQQFVFCPQFFICAPEVKFQKGFMFITRGTGLVHLYNPLTEVLSGSQTAKLFFFFCNNSLRFAEMEA